MENALKVSSIQAVLRKGSPLSNYISDYLDPLQHMPFIIFTPMPTLPSVSLNKFSIYLTVLILDALDTNASSYIDILCIIHLVR